VWRVCPSDGSSLPLGEQLHWAWQLQGVPALSCLCAPDHLNCANHKCICLSILRLKFILMEQRRKAAFIQGAATFADAEIALVYAFWLHFRQGWYIVRSKQAARTFGWLLLNPRHAKASFVIWLTMLETSAAVLTLPLAIGVGSLLGWHIYITSQVRHEGDRCYEAPAVQHLKQHRMQNKITIQHLRQHHMQNKTTIEYHEGVTAHEHYSQSGELYKHPYDLGVKRNWEQVLGLNRRLWWLCGLTPSGDGTVFPTGLNQETLERLRHEFLKRTRADERV
jgi:hypothetical protein